MLENLFLRRNKKIKKILNAKIILINGVEERYSNLCLKNYGLPLKVKERDKVKVIFPRLTPNGDVEYIFSWHNLDDVEIPEFEIDQNDIKLNGSKSLSIAKSSGGSTVRSIFNLLRTKASFWM